ncbi:hypothetical protein JCM10908_005956 [Rhodotorula pacifica]|uniref:uncharacterized protein n=1 Tax=Rhodotorula pacifica TaxID=1495444 RepID=UPI00316BD0A0
MGELRASDLLDQQSARALARRQKATDALIAARWLPLLPYLEDVEVDEWGNVIYGGETAAPAPSPSAPPSSDSRSSTESNRERTAASQSSHPRRPSLLRYLSRSSSGATDSVPLHPVDEREPDEPPPPYDSLSRSSTRESIPQANPRMRAEITDDERVISWLSGRDNVAVNDVAPLVGCEHMPGRVQRAASAASADSGYASLYTVHTRIDAHVGAGPEQRCFPAPEPSSESAGRRRFSILGLRKNNTRRASSDVVLRTENG